MSHLENRKRLSIKHIVKKKADGEKITMLTCYDYATACILNETELDIALVGDSLGNVFAGHQTTLPVKIEDIIYHTRAVGRGIEYALLVADMPFLSFQISPQDALVNAGIIMKETPASAVKLEGGKEYAETVHKLTSSGIPVMGHIGLRPQLVNQLGGYRVFGKTESGVNALIEDALALQDAGAFSVVLELVPKEAAQRVSQALEIPTIGIGAGNGCDGQVLVINDMLGMSNAEFKHTRKYLNLYNDIKGAVNQYVTDVKSGSFPGDNESF